jgi:hypothetical protein
MPPTREEAAVERSTKQGWLEGPGDLREADVEDVPVPGKSVRVRGLPAAYSNEATSEAMEMKVTPRGDQIGTVNKARMEVLQFAHGVIDPEFTVAEAELIAKRFGPAFNRVIEKIDELSGVDKEAIDQAATTFPAGGAVEGNGREAGDAAGAGDGGSDLRVRTGA